MADVSSSRTKKYLDEEWSKRIKAVFDKLTKGDYQGKINEAYSDIEYSKIDEAADFPIDEGKLSNFLDEIGEPLINSYWNESISALYKYFKDSISKDDYEENKEDDWNKRIKLIKDANAGFSFLNDPYVKPDLNIDNDSYEDVRGDDKIESVLQNSKNMQYTHTQEQIDGKILNKYIRLLMPKYTRRVEVEDLNRNFWVIGQALGLMSAYLLDPESALNQILNAILNELGEIWNNIYELWAIIGDLCGEIYNLWLKTDEIESQINELGSAINKTQITINLRNNSAGSSFGGTIQGDGQFYSLISYLMGPNNKGEYPKITSIEDTECYYIGGHEFETAVQDEGVSKNSYNNFIKKYPWIQTDFFSIQEDNEKYAINLSITMDYENRVSKITNPDHTLVSETFFNYYDIFGNKSFEEGGDQISGPRKGVFFKITGTRKYSSSGSEDENFEEYFVFDCNHPCIIDDEKMAMEIFGKWYFLTGGNGVFHFPINRAIYNCSKLENEIFASETENEFCNGLFNFRRATYDRRKVAEIAHDMMEYNMYLTPMVKSYPNFHGLTIGDMLTKNVKITEDLQKSIFKKFIGNLKDYGYSITDEFKLKSDEMAITATGLSKLYSLLKYGSDTNPPEQYINSVIKHIKNSNNELAFFEEYINFENDQTYENYSILVIKILEFFGISYKDYLKENAPLDTSSGVLEEWLRPYEDWINDKEKETNFTDMEFKSFNIYMTPNPFVITGPSTKVGDVSGGRKYIQKYGGNIEDSLFFLSIRLLPEESVLWGEQVVLNDTKTGFRIDPLLRSINSYKNYFQNADDGKIIESFARSGALKGDSGSSRSAYLTPHRAGKDFSNYWIKFECPETSNQILTAGLNLGISNISFYENHTHTIMTGYITSGQSINNFNNIDIDIPINFLRVDVSDTNLRVCDFYQINSPCPTNNGILCLSPRSYSDKNFSKISTPPSFRYYVDNNKSIKRKFYNRFFNYNENNYWYIIDGLLGIGKGKSFEENLSGGFYNGGSVDKSNIEDFKNKLGDDRCVYDELYNRDISEITFFRYTDDIETDGNNSGHIMSPACYICNEKGGLKEPELNNNCYTKIHYMGPCSAIPMYLDHNQNNIIQNTNITWNDVTFEGINYLDEDKSKKLGLKIKFYDGDVFNNWNSILFGVEISKENGLLLPKRTVGENLWA